MGRFGAVAAAVREFEASRVGFCLGVALCALRLSHELLLSCCTSAASARQRGVRGTRLAHRVDCRNSMDPEAGSLVLSCVHLRRFCLSCALPQPPPDVDGLGVALRVQPDGAFVRAGAAFPVRNRRSRAACHCIGGQARRTALGGSSCDETGAKVAVDVLVHGHGPPRLHLRSAAEV